MTVRPNIIQITTHDSGRHFGCYGHPTLHTPNIDSLAADGVRLANYFAAAPICCASRASMLTGRYPQSHGLMDLCFPPFDWALKNDAQHITHILHGAGYRTLLFGFQHEALNLDRLLFDAVRVNYPPLLVPCDRVAGEVAQFLRESAGAQQPFYAQVGFFETHTPFNFGGAEPDTSKGIEIPPYLADVDTSRAAMAGYQGAIRKVDAALGVILDALRTSGLEQNTILVFTTDHGIEVPRSKWFLYDPGIAIGLVLRYPKENLTGGRHYDLLLSNVDYLPTMLELARIDIPAYIEGRSFAAGLRGQQAHPAQEAVFAMFHQTNARCVRTALFKLIRYFDAATDFHTVPVSYENSLRRRCIKRVELFDLKADPHEFNSIAYQPEHADVQRRLDGMLWKWMESVHDPLLVGPVRTPAYEAAIKDYAEHLSLSP